MPSNDHILTVGLVQRAGSDDVQTNVRSALDGAREAASKGARIICLQEMFNAPYFCKAEEHARFNYAEPILPPDTGPTVRACQDAAKQLKAVIIAPVFERRAQGLYHNSAAVIDADGTLLGLYRKMTIPDDPLYYEKFYFTPGDASGPPVCVEGAARTSHGYASWKTRAGNVGVLICWDQWYPENARITSLLGPDILFYPTAIGYHPDEKSQYGPAQRDSWITIQRSHAIANGLFVAAVNRVGHEPEPNTKGIEFFGASFVADPAGQIIAQAPDHEESVLVVPCDRRLIRERREHWPFLRDRRVDAFSPILQRWLGAP